MRITLWRFGWFAFFYCLRRSYRDIITDNKNRINIDCLMLAVSSQILVDKYTCYIGIYLLIYNSENFNSTIVSIYTVYIQTRKPHWNRTTTRIINWGGQLNSRRMEISLRAIKPRSKSKRHTFAKLDPFLSTFDLDKKKTTTSRSETNLRLFTRSVKIMRRILRSSLRIFRGKEPRNRRR